MKNSTIQSPELARENVDELQLASKAIFAAFRYPENTSVARFKIENPIIGDNVPEEEIERIRSGAVALKKAFRYPTVEAV